MNQVLLRYLIRAVVSITLANICCVATATTLDVIGWAPALQINLKEKAPIWLGDDPVLGRLACPAVVRLEGDHLKNAPLLLKSPPIIERFGKGERWYFNLRPGLRWWSGASVNADGFAIWLRSSLVEAALEKLGVAIPANVEVSAINQLTVRVEWPTAPSFGPYILSGISLSRPASGQIECVGLYAATQLTDGIELNLNKGYTAKYSKIRVSGSIGSKIQNDHQLFFSMAGKASKATSTKIVTNSCATRLDIPLVTALIWNPSTALAATPSLREALTMATPRGEILRTASGDIGTLISAPILRTHPGYSSRSLVRPYSLDAAGQAFEKSGFTQPHIGLPRLKTAGKSLYLRIARMSGRQDLVEKIISDSYASLGIETQFDDPGSTGTTFDAALASVFIPWTSQDLRSVAHSSVLNSSERGKVPFPFVSANDKALDESLDAYSRTLSRAEPDFGLLRKVHDGWYNLEPWTILMAHQYCVGANGINLPQKINSLDPDWFRRLAVD